MIKETKLFDRCLSMSNINIPPRIPNSDYKKLSRVECNIKDYRELIHIFNLKSNEYDFASFQFFSNEIEDYIEITEIFIDYMWVVPYSSYVQYHPLVLEYLRLKDREEKLEALV